MSDPLVSIIVPTISARYELLTVRCLKSIQEQTYKNIEVVVVSDGQLVIDGYWNPKLGKLIQLGRNWRQFSHGASYGAIPRAVGTYMARGDIIGYLDDDDEYLPEHVAKHVAFLQENQAMFSVSQFKRFWSNGNTPDIIGGRIEYGQIGTPCVMHRAECLLTANWGLNGYGEDFQLFDAWKKAGLKHVFLNEVTIHVHKQV